MQVTTELLPGSRERSGPDQPGQKRPDEDLLRQEYQRERADAAAFMRKSAWVIIVFVSVLVGVLALAGKHDAGRMVGNLLLLCVSAVTLPLLRRGHHSLASGLFVAGNWVAITVLVWFTGGFDSVLSGAWVLLIGYASWLLKPRWLLGLGAVTAVTMAMMGYAEQLGWLPAAAPTTPVARAAALLMLFALGTALFYSFSLAVRHRLNEVARSRDQIARSAAAREASQRQLQLVAENVSAMLLHVDAQARYLWFNQRYADFYGVELAQAVGRPIADVAGAQSAANVIALRDRVVASRHSLTTEYVRRDKDGRSRVMRSELVPEFGPGGEVKGIFNLIQDITETRRRADLMAALATGTAGATDALFFCRLVESLATILGVGFALVTELVEGGARARSLGFWGGGVLLPNITYDLAGTPCKIALETGAIFVDHGAARRFADDRALTVKGIESYLGVALPGSDGQPIGVLAIMDVRAMEDDPDRLAAIRVFANRAAAELERMRGADALRRSEERFAALFQGSPAALSVINLQTHQYVNVNAAWCRLTGYQDPGEVVGRVSTDIPLFSIEHRMELGELLRQDGFVEHHEVSMCTRDGSQRTVLLSGRQLRESGGATLNVWWSVDVTAERKATAGVQELNATLESRVAQRTAELQSALDDLNTSQDALVRAARLAALGRLVAGVAHELNTPIGNALLTASTMAEHTEAFARVVETGLRRSALDAFVASSREGAQIMLTNLEKAAQLISSFKQVATDQSSVQRREFGLNDVLQEVLLAYHPVLRKAGATAQTAIPGDITLDSYPGPLGQIIGNLLTNAVLHGFEGRDGGNIQIGASLEPQGWVRLEVSDNGVGIPPAEQQRVFDPFFTTKMGRGGTGLGLSICHRIVSDILGGTIAMSSSVGTGSNFVVRIPQKAPALAPAALEDAV